MESPSQGLEPRPKVLVVDDDASLAGAIQRVLRQMGFVTDVATDGPSALRRIEEHYYDVMVLDLQMGSMDGLEVLRAARRRPTAPATILHSAFLDVPTTVRAMRAGVTEVIEKPVAAMVLADRIIELAKGRRTPEAEIAGRTLSPGDPAPRALPLLGDSSAMRGLRSQLQRIAGFREISVLITGETGTGKELVAQALHFATARNEPFVCVNCAAVPEHLFESELFGHDAGAFTSARGARMGLLEEAGNGTIFLDEIGEMPASLQPKLLRALESREFRRVGSNRARCFRARVVSATNRPLSRQLGTSFRADLYFRLAGYTIAMPPLRDRVEDLPIFAEHFLGKFAERYQSPPLTLTASALELLCSHTWPGNVRELRTVMENAAIIAADRVVDRAVIEVCLAARGAQFDETYTSVVHESGVVRVVCPDSAPSSGPRKQPSLPDIERGLIMEAYETAGGNLSQAARHLGIPRSTLRDKLKKYGAR